MGRREEGGGGGGLAGRYPKGQGRQGGGGEKQGDACEEESVTFAEAAVVTRPFGRHTCCLAGSFAVLEAGDSL